MRNKTPQQKQLQGERLELQITDKMQELRIQLFRLERRLSKVRETLNDLDDPHALIPKDCKTFDDWIADHPFPFSCIGHIYKNKTKAEIASYCYYVYQEDYHIVPCEPKEYYKQKYKDRFK